MTSKSDEIVQQVQHEFQTLLADLTGSESTGVVYLDRAVNDVPTAAHEPQLHERELLWKSRTPSPDASTSPARTSS